MHQRKRPAAEHHHHLALCISLSAILYLEPVSPPGVLIIQPDLSSIAAQVRLQPGFVLEQLLDEVDVGHDHAAAAVAVELELIHGVAVADVLAEKNEVAFPEVADDLWRELGRVGWVGEVDIPCRRRSSALG